MVKSSDGFVTDVFPQFARVTILTSSQFAYLSNSGLCVVMITCFYFDTSSAEEIRLASNLGCIFRSGSSRIIILE